MAETDTARPPQVPLRRVARLFAPHRGQLAALFGLIAVASLVTLAPPFMLRQILDTAIPQGRTGLLSALGGGMVLLAAVATAASVSLAYLSLSVSQQIMHDLRGAVYAHLQRMSLSFFTKTRTGEVQSRIANDIGGMGMTVTNIATTIVGSATTVVATLVAMVSLDWRLTCASVLTLPVFVAIGSKVGNERRTVTKERQKQLAKISSLVEESLSVHGFMLGRVMGRSTALSEHFTRESLTLTDLTIRSSMAGRWRQSTIQLVMAVMPVLIYWVAGLTAQHGRPAVSIGTLVAFTTLQQALFNPSLQLLQSGIAVQSSMSMFERVFEYLDLPIDIAEPATPVPLPHPRGHVRFDQVGFAYGDRPVLHGIDINLPPGTHLAVVGATGAGKTSLGHLVARLYDVSEGRITIDGTDVRDLSFAALARTVGIVSQDTHLLHASIADNLRFAKPDATDEELVAAATAAQLHELVASLPDGYETVVGERGYRFSGGEKQRVAIARTMLRNTPVLVLDEATSALDTRTERALQQALDTLCADRTTITIAHRLSTVRDADQIIVLDQGRITERGTHGELLAKAGQYAALLRESTPAKATV